MAVEHSTAWNQFYHECFFYNTSEMATQVLTVSNGIKTNGTTVAKPKSKNQYKRLKAKHKKTTVGSSRESSVVSGCVVSSSIHAAQGLTSCHLWQATTGYESALSEIDATDDEGGDPNIEYVTEALDVQPGLEAFSDVFARFQLRSEGDAVSGLRVYFFILAQALICYSVTLEGQRFRGHERRRDLLR